MPEVEPIDLERFAYESRRAIEAGGVLVDQLDPGLNVIPHDDHLELVDCHGTTVGTIPKYRLARIDPELTQLLVRLVVAVGVDSHPPHIQDQLLAAARDASITIRDRVNGEHVDLEINGVKVTSIHRRYLVPWPRPDDGEVAP